MGWWTSPTIKAGGNIDEKAAETSGGFFLRVYTLTGDCCLTGTGVSQLKRSSTTPFTIP